MSLLRAIVLLLAYLSTASAAGTDMSATFAKLTDCNSCVAQGYGWCTIRRMCGGFAAKTCGIGPQYFSEKKVASSQSSPPPPPKKKRRTPPPSPPEGPSTDMSATFAKFRDCSSCVGAGYGWCTIRRMCGGFAAKTCGIGPQYMAEGPAPKASSPPRNGLWESKADKARKANAQKANAEKLPTELPPASEVPSAASPPPASLLYAGPASPPTRAQVAPMGAAVESEPSTVTASVAADPLSNATADLKKSELMSLPTEALVAKILSLQSKIDVLQGGR